MIGVAFRKLRSILSWGIYKSLAEDDLLERQRYKLFFIFSASGFLICLAESFHAISFNTDNNILGPGLQVFALTFISNYLLLQSHKKLKLAYLIGILTAFSCVHLFNYYYGGIRNAGNFYYLVMIITTFMLLGKQYGWMMMGLSIINQIYFFYVSDNPEMIMNVLAANNSDLNQDFLFSTGMAVVAIAALSNSLGSSKNIVIEKITESQKTLAIKNKELRKLSLVASKTDSAVIISDHNAVITWVNDGFTRLTGYFPNEVIGKKNDDFLYGAPTDFSVVQNMNAVLKLKKTFVGELELIHKNGQKFWSQISVTPILDSDNEVIEYVSLQDDITERKNAENKIKDYLKDLEKTNKELDEFAYVVSHDLKAPLHAISNLTSWIEDDMKGQFSDETSSNFNIIKSRVSRMEDLINGLLEFARANHKKGEKSSVNLNDFINEVIEFCAVPPNCSIAIVNELPVLYGDKIKFQQIFANLIGNAIKYNDKPEIHIIISAEEKENEWLLSVKDNGPGIDSRFHEKVFVIFQTLNPRDTVESTGVGLAIVKKIIEEEGGEIWVESQPGMGADFRFTWLKEPRPEMYQFQGTMNYFQ
ncbi:MAG: PAS domain-containing protein [Bacteroidetes bacterium]|nr:PAS domain-containing protein [Bacteroidota bacterium]